MIWFARYRWHHRTIFGVLRAVNANWNDDGWNFNANPLDNDWNDNNRFVSRNYRCSPEDGLGSLLSIPFFQPPSILPISSNCPEMIEYFSVGISFNSQDVCRRNFIISSLDMQRFIPSTFLSITRKDVRYTCSRNSMKCKSVLYPMPHRSTRGKFL